MTAMNWENADKAVSRYMREGRFDVRKQFFAGFLTPSRDAIIDKRDTVLRRFTVTLVIQGSGRFADNTGVEVELLPGILLLRPPGTVFSIRREPVERNYREFVMNLPGELYTVLYDTELAPARTTVMKLALDKLLLTRTMGLVESLERVKNYHFAPFLIDVIRYLDYLKKNADRTRPPEHQALFEKACRLLERDFSGECSLEHVARQLGVSSRTLRTLFQANLGIGPNEYRLRCKFEQAGHLLLHSRLSVKEIAVRTGYAHSQGFCRQFRELLGCSPAAYRKKYIGLTDS